MGTVLLRPANRLLLRLSVRYAHAFAPINYSIRTQKLQADQAGVRIAGGTLSRIHDHGLGNIEFRQSIRGWMRDS
jgi:hypothetical protein